MSARVLYLNLSKSIPIYFPSQLDRNKKKHAKYFHAKRTKCDVKWSLPRAQLLVEPGLSPALLPLPGAGNKLGALISVSTTTAAKHTVVVGTGVCDPNAVVVDLTRRLLKQQH